MNTVNRAEQQSFPASGKVLRCLMIPVQTSELKVLKSRVWFNGIHGSYFTILIDCLFYPIFF